MSETVKASGKQQETPPELPTVAVPIDRAQATTTLFRAWQSGFPAAVCDAVVDAFADHEYQPARIERLGQGASLAPERRTANHLFIEGQHWAGALVTHYAHQGNLLWRRELVGLGTLSIVRYDAGGHFTWHIDDVAYQAQSYPHLGDNLYRKLSVSINLSDPADYDGGDLEFRNALGQANGPDIRPQGTVVVFPSNVAHRVSPVTRGTRYALIGWMVGPELR